MGPQSRFEAKMNLSLHPTAQIDAGLLCGYNVVIEEDVRIGVDCRIGHGVIIHAGTQIGDKVRIDDNAVIGKMPMRSARSSMTVKMDLAPCVIGDHCIIGSHTVIYRGALIEEGVMIADLASVREQTVIGSYTIIGRGVTVENRVAIGTRCKVESNAYVTALSSVGDDCFIAPEVTFTNDNFLGRTKERFRRHRGVTMLNGARVGANATILPGITIGEDGLVAAGSVVTRDVLDRMTVLGAPAREHRPVPEEQLLEHQS
jgi:acetyltransferase-like isoleucine patch superfamily enzyme